MPQGDDLSAEIERLRAENEALRASLAAEVERFRLLFESAPIAIGIFSFEEARFLDVNERYLQMTDCTREEFFRLDPYDLWTKRTHPDDFEKDREALMRVVEGKAESSRLKKRLLMKGGEYRWFDFASDTVR